MSKLRILQINKFYSPWIGGIESVIKEIAEKLNDRTDMKVLVCQPKGSKAFDIVNGVSVTRCASMGVLCSMPISFSFISTVRKMSKEADVLILHDPFPLGDLAVLLSGFKGKVIVWWHSDIIRQKKLRKVIDPIIHGILKRADAIFTTSEQYIDGSEYISKYRNKCRIVRYGLDIPKYLDTERTSILTENINDKNKVKILFVGRLVYYKGVKVLIDAFKDISGAELFIVGTGADEETIRNEAVLCKEPVHFLGNLSDSDLKSAFADCDFFVLPSTEKSEAFGIVQLEAMIYGKPVINTNLDTSVPYVSLDGVSGITVPVGNADELKKAMLTLINNSELRKTYGRNGYNRVLELFDLNKTAENVLNICKKLSEADM